MSFNPIDEKLVMGRARSPSAADPRLAERIYAQTLDGSEWIIAGYPDDEGVRLNQGRAGADQGPDIIRRYLYRMTPAAFSKDAVHVHDLGNLEVTGSLAERHESARTHAFKNFDAGRRLIALGGGHDYAYSDVSAFLDWCKKNGKRGTVLNFDAHLDLREYDQAFHSGTGFRRVVDSQKDFDFYEIGIQSQCNSQAHVQYARNHGVKIISWNEIELAGSRGQAELILARLESLLIRPTPTFLSVDLDAFALPLSLGTSAPSVTGFTAETFLPLWETLRSRCDVRGAGFYEHSPIHDPGHNTARLAALLVHRLVTS